MGYRRKECSVSCPSQGCLISPGVSEPWLLQNPISAFKVFLRLFKKSVLAFDPFVLLWATSLTNCVFPLFWEREGRKTGLELLDWDRHQHCVSLFESLGTEGLCCGLRNAAGGPVLSVRGVCPC